MYEPNKLTKKLGAAPFAFGAKFAAAFAFGVKFGSAAADEFFAELNFNAFIALLII
jgi:hypothetical protein